MAGGVGGTRLRGTTGVGVGGRRVVGAGTVVAAGVVGAGPVGAARVVGAGPVVARGVVAVLSAAAGAVDEGPSGAGEVVRAGPAVARRGGVSGDPAEEVAVRGRWTVVRGGPVLEVWAVVAVALEKG